jgi:hypothetical protein
MAAMVWAGELSRGVGGLLIGIRLSAGAWWWRRLCAAQELLAS